MNYILDIHSHSVASGHAYSTIEEMVKSAADKGLELLAITEHGPKMPGAPHMFYFHNLKVLPRKINGVEVLYGAEVNILDNTGTVDIDDVTLSKMDIVIASLHPPCIESKDISHNTAAVIGAMKNPYVNIIGHPDDSRYPLDYEQIVLAAKENNVLIEINNSSLDSNSFRRNAKENYEEILRLCMKHNVPVVIGSDAHVSFDVGNTEYVQKIFASIGFPEELVINNSVEKLKKYLRK